MWHIHLEMLLSVPAEEHRADRQTAASQHGRRVYWTSIHGLYHIDYVRVGCVSQHAHVSC